MQERKSVLRMNRIQTMNVLLKMTILLLLIGCDQYLFVQCRLFGAATFVHTFKRTKCNWSFEPVTLTMFTSCLITDFTHYQVAKMLQNQTICLELEEMTLGWGVKYAKIFLLTTEQARPLRSAFMARSQQWTRMKNIPVTVCSMCCTLMAKMSGCLWNNYSIF